MKVYGTGSLKPWYWYIHYTELSKEVAPHEWSDLEKTLRRNARAASKKPPSTERTERRARKKRARGTGET